VLSQSVEIAIVEAITVHLHRRMNKAKFKKAA
jgi:hypothetical protein